MTRCLDHRYYHGAAILQPGERAGGLEAPKCGPDGMWRNWQPGNKLGPHHPSTYKIYFLRSVNRIKGGRVEFII